MKKETFEKKHKALMDEMLTQIQIRNKAIVEINKIMKKIHKLEERYYQIEEDEE